MTLDDELVAAAAEARHLLLKLKLGGPCIIDPVLMEEIETTEERLWNALFPGAAAKEKA